MSRAILVIMSVLALQRAPSQPVEVAVSRMRVDFAADTNPGQTVYVSATVTAPSEVEAIFRNEDGAQAAEPIKQKVDSGTSTFKTTITAPFRKATVDITATAPARLRGFGVSTHLIRDQNQRETAFNSRIDSVTCSAGTCLIRYTLAEDAQTDLDAHQDLPRRRIRDNVEPPAQHPRGAQTANWDERDDRQQRVPLGQYVISLQTRSNGSIANMSSDPFTVR
jgi:hypothetical protein